MAQANLFPNRFPMCEQIEMTAITIEDLGRAYLSDKQSILSLNWSVVTSNSQILPRHSVCVPDITKSLLYTYCTSQLKIRATAGDQLRAGIY